MYGTSAFGSVPYAAAPTGTATNYNETISDGAVGHTTLAPLVTAMLFSLVTATTPVASKANQHMLVSDHAAATTALVVAWHNAIGDTANATTALGFGVIAQIVDAILASGQVASVVAAKNSLIETVFAADSLNRAWPASVSDAIAATDAMQSHLVTLVLQVDHALAQAALTGQANATVAIADDVQVTDLYQHMLAAHESMQDGVIAVLSFELDGDVFTGVVFNTETGAPSEYTEFPLNSFGEFGGRYCGAAADGIYALDGPDDAGTPIDSFIRTGLMKVAAGQRARVPTAYFGYTSTGKLVLKVVTTSPDGVKSENWYYLEPRDASAPRSNRVKIGKGLSSVYWGYELHSVDGSQFGLDTVELFPMPLERRI